MVDLETNYLGLTYLNSVEDCGFHQLYGFFHTNTIKVIKYKSYTTFPERSTILSNL